MAQPTFFKCSVSDEVEELKTFLRNYGVENVDKTEVTQENWPSVVVNCIPQLSVCWNNEKITEKDTIDLLITVSSLIIQMPPNEIQSATEKLCKLYTDFAGEKSVKHSAKLYSLNVLFSGLSQEHHSRFTIYQALVSCAFQMGQLHLVFTDSEKVANLLKTCGCSPSECQAMWRQLSEVHRASSNIKQATQTMIKLLSTYTDGTAAGAHDDAFRCIISAVEDSSFLSYSKLMTLKPIRFLEGQPVHTFLRIYVSGGLSDFAAFTKKHPHFLSENKLDEKACLDKLRTLSLMEIAENVAELDYETICKKIDLPEDQLEAFIIEAVRKQVITCKLDQISRRILITGALPRNFGRPQWQCLYKTLTDWELGLRTVQDSLGSMVGTVAAAAAVASQ